MTADKIYDIDAFFGTQSFLDKNNIPKQYIQFLCIISFEAYSMWKFFLHTISAHCSKSISTLLLLFVCDMR